MAGTPRINDICEKLGLSKATVSKALNGYPSVKEETRNAVLACAQELGYSTGIPRLPDPGRRLRVGIPFMPSYAFQALSNPFSQIQSCFIEQITRYNYEMIMMPPSYFSDQSVPLEQMIRELQLDCLFINGLRTTDPYYEQLKSTATPTVTWDLAISNPNVHNVSCDSRQGLLLAVQHLTGLGHRKIGFNCGHKEAEVSWLRLDGYALGLMRSGIPFDPELVYYGDFSEESGSEGAEYLLKRGVTAIACISDLTAIGAMHFLQQKGLNVPGDISLIGYDDTPQAGLVRPALSSISQNCIEIGRAAASMLYAMQLGMAVGDVVVQPKLVVRDSTLRCQT